MKFAIIDDHIIFAEGLKMLLKQKQDVEVDLYNDGLLFLKQFTGDQKKYDLLIIDLQMPTINGLDLIQKIKNINNEIPIVVLTMVTENEILKQVLKTTVNALVLKNGDFGNLENAINLVFEEDVYIDKNVIDTQNIQANILLSLREIEVLKMVAQGHTSKAIADLLKISEHTVNGHRRKILSKLQMKSSIEIAAYANKNGWV